jgi:hypothetical protein
MRITESAAKAILQVMVKKGLNPKQVHFEIGMFDGSFGIRFNKDRHGKIMQFGPLTVVVADNVDTTGVVLDFGEINGRKGLLFTGEEQYVNNTNHSDGTSDQGSQTSDVGTGVQP